MSLTTLFASTSLNPNNTGVLVSGNFGSASYQWGGTSYALGALPGGTYTGPSVATYSLDGSTLFTAGAPRVTSAGLLVEAAATNIAVGSSDLSNTTNWPDFSAGNNNRAAGFTAPDGSATAVHLMPTSANSPGHHLVEQPVTASGTTTFSIFAKAGEYNYLVFSGFSYNYCSVNLTTGAITDGASGLSGFTAVSVGNGWWRCSATGSGNWGGQIQFGAAPDNSNAAFTGDGTSGIYVWGPQFELGSSATSLIPTTSAAVTRTADVATQTYTGTATSVTVTTSGLGAMTYPIAGVTNLIQQSANAYTTSPWAAFDVGGYTGTASATTAPDGTTTGFLFADTVQSSYHFFLQPFTYSIGTTYTWSVYTKAQSSSTKYVTIDCYDGTSDYGISFNPATGAVGQVRSGGTLVGYGSSAAAGGWYRIWMTFTAANNASSNAQVGLIPSGGLWANQLYLGDGTGAYFWGAQLETGSTPSGYVPTTSAAATITPSSPFNFAQAPFLGQKIQTFGIFGTAASGSGIGSAIGSGTASAIGQAIAAAGATAAGVGAAAAVGAALFAATATSIGTGAASGTGGAIVAATATSAGSSTASGASASGSIGSGVGSSTGAGAASGVGGSTNAGAANSTGAGAAAGAGASAAASTATTAGSGSASGVTTAIDATTATAAGSGTATGVGTAITTSIATAAGSGTASGVAVETSAATGTAAGTSTASATTGSGSPGTSVGTSTATGVGASSATSTATSAGTGTASATGLGTAAVTATSAGAGNASATGNAITAAQATASGSGAASGAITAQSAAVASAAGSGAASGAGSTLSTGSATASSSGTSSAAGVATAQVTTTGTVAASSLANAVGSGVAAGQATAAGTSTAAATSATQFASTATAAGSSTAQALTALTIAAIATAFGTSTALAIYAGGIIVWRRVFGSGSRAIISGRADRKTLSGQASRTTITGQSE